MAHLPSLTQLSTSPVFNTKAVARETGVPADTFRAWERRYGIPRPQRTPGGHRLYSERDIAIIRWLRERTEAGVNISHAIMLLTNILDMPPSSVAGREEARPLDRIAEDVVLALAHFDAQQAEQLLGEAFAIYPFEQVLVGLIQPAMVEIGERWHRGEINVAIEHFATQFVRRKVASLLNIFESNGQRGTIVVGCGPSELHDLGILLIALFLARRGWHVVYLGPQVPLADLIETLRVVRPGLVCLSASTAETAIELVTVAREVLQVFPQVHFGYGGRVFNSNPELRRAIPGTFLGHDAREVVETVETLLRRHSTSAPE